MIDSILPKPRELQIGEGFYQGELQQVKQIGDDSLEAEGYCLKIGAQAIEMRAKTQVGFYYAEQTLRQLQRRNGGKLPLCEIVDAPVFAHRGFMLDCVRHFFPVADLKRLIEAAARMKLNRFHWHLTDDQGWRIQIDAFPKLTQLASMRPCSNFGRYREAGPHGGFYTKEEIREIVAFCAERQITVIPEIEMPGHASALLSAYPEFSCDGKPVQVKTRGGVHADTLCAGKEETYAALESILTEVMELFPGKRIHLGGDEAPKDHWKACPLCQRRASKARLSCNAGSQTAWRISSNPTDARRSYGTTRSRGAAASARRSRCNIGWAGTTPPPSRTQMRAGRSSSRQPFLTILTCAMASFRWIGRMPMCPIFRNKIVRRVRSALKPQSGQNICRI